MKLRHSLRRAVQLRDLDRLAGILDLLRSKGYTYGRIYAIAKRETGIELAEWDALMEEIEEA